MSTDIFLPPFYKNIIDLCSHDFDPCRFQLSLTLMQWMSFRKLCLLSNLEQWEVVCRARDCLGKILVIHCPFSICVQACSPGHMQTSVPAKVSEFGLPNLTSFLYHCQHAMLARNWLNYQEKASFSNHLHKICCEFSKY